MISMGYWKRADHKGVGQWLIWERRRVIEHLTILIVVVVRDLEVFVKTHKPVQFKKKKSEFYYKCFTA